MFASTLSDTFERRKTEVQDILSSFCRETLPSEFRPELLQSLHEDQSRRPAIEWTIPDDLVATLVNWGVHDETCYRFLQRAQPPGTRSVLFHQKIARRLKIEFEKYAAIRKRSLFDREIWEGTHEIAKNLRRIVQESWNRQVLEAKASPAAPFIEALSEVCDSYDIDSHGHGQETTSSNRSQRSGSSLFRVLVLEHHQDMFMLDLLEWMANDFVERLAPHVDALEVITGKLVELKSPERYLNRFQGIIDKVTPHEERA